MNIIMKIKVNPFSVPWPENDPPQIGVLENVLVCAQWSSKLAHGT